jgi:hypothetical protein
MLAKRIAGPYTFVMTAYIRFVFLCVRGGSIAILILAALMAGVGGADCSMRLGWGWDCASLPILGLVALAAIGVFVSAGFIRRVLFE